MVLLTPPIDTTLPEAPVAMVQSVAKEKWEDKKPDIAERFQELIAEIFEQGLIADKTEDELMEITARLVVAILEEQSWNMTPDVMNPYYALKERIKTEKNLLKPKPITIDTPKPSIGMKKLMTIAMIAWVMRTKED